MDARVERRDSASSTDDFVTCRSRDYPLEQPKGGWTPQLQTTSTIEWCSSESDDEFDENGLQGTAVKIAMSPARSLPNPERKRYGKEQRSTAMSMDFRNYGEKIRRAAGIGGADRHSKRFLSKSVSATAVKSASPFAHRPCQSCSSMSRSPASKAAGIRVPSRTNENRNVRSSEPTDKYHGWKEGLSRRLRLRKEPSPVPAFNCPLSTLPKVGLNVSSSRRTGESVSDSETDCEGTTSNRTEEPDVVNENPVQRRRAGLEGEDNLILKLNAAISQIEMYTNRKGRNPAGNPSVATPASTESSLIRCGAFSPLSDAKESASVKSEFTQQRRNAIVATPGQEKNPGGYKWLSSLKESESLEDVKILQVPKTVFELTAMSGTWERISVDASDLDVSVLGGGWPHQIAWAKTDKLQVRVSKSHLELMLHIFGWWYHKEEYKWGGLKNKLPRRDMRSGLANGTIERTPKGWSTRLSWTDPNSLRIAEYFEFSANGQELAVTASITNESGKMCTTRSIFSRSERRRWLG